MSLYDNENKIIETFQDEKAKQICIIPQTEDVCQILDCIYDKENWRLWKDSSGKGAPPPDFYSEHFKIMMDVMRIDDHAYENSKGKIINPTLKKENEIYNEIINSDFIKNMNFKGDIIVNAVTDLPSYEDHNYGFYLKNFERVINKHIKSIPLYKSNHPGFKVIFFMFDESSGYLEKEGYTNTRKKGEAVRGRIHNWFLDENFINVLKESEIDYLIWYCPFKHYIGIDENILPRACIYDIKNIDTKILQRYNKEKMDSTEV